MERGYPWSYATPTDRMAPGCMKHPNEEAKDV